MPEERDRSRSPKRAGVDEPAKDYIPQIVAQFPESAPRPSSMSELVAALHAGSLFALSPTTASLELVGHAGKLVKEALGTEGEWDAVRRIPDPYPKLDGARKGLSANTVSKKLIAEVCNSLGLSGDSKVDAPRLRSIVAGSELSDSAKPVYLLHRDTWYGCPQSLLVAWMPLHDVRAEEVFAFYPDCFERPVPNDSQKHDQGKWMHEVGWHGKTDPKNFAAPKDEEMPLGQQVRWSLKAGSIVLFSAAQLHQTMPNPTPGNTRYSLDFRLLPVASTEAPNVDNESTGAEARVKAEFWPIREMLVN